MSSLCTLKEWKVVPYLCQNSPFTLSHQTTQSLNFPDPDRESSSATPSCTAFIGVIVATSHKAAQQGKVKIGNIRKCVLPAHSLWTKTTVLTFEKMHQVLRVSVSSEFLYWKRIRGDPHWKWSGEESQALHLCETPFLTCLHLGNPCLVNLNKAETRLKWCVWKCLKNTKLSKGCKNYYCCYYYWWTSVPRLGVSTSCLAYSWVLFLNPW